MTDIYTKKQILSVLDKLDITTPISDGFVAYSKGKVVVPPVGELVFKEPPGDTHIKYGYIKGQDNYVIKIASGFYKNPVLGLSSSSGLMLVFSQKTGFPKAILLDEGYLTDVRTAIAGQIAARCLAPKDIRGIGVLGSGIQSRMQVDYLKSVTPCRNVHVWGRTASHVDQYKKEMEQKGFDVYPEDSPADVAKACNLIVTTTPSDHPLLHRDEIQPGTHITAMGSDTSSKQELDSGILEKADYVVADSVIQCLERGEISKAVNQRCLDKADILELGQVIETPNVIQRTDSMITIADLTGVAVQDIQIASVICQAFKNESQND